MMEEKYMSMKFLLKRVRLKRLIALLLIITITAVDRRINNEEIIIIDSTYCFGNLYIRI